MSRSVAGELDRVLPGITRVFSGLSSGFWILGSWLTLVGLAVWRFPRLVAAVSEGGPGNWVAVGTLLAGLAACWLAGNAAVGGPGVMSGSSALAIGIRRFAVHRRAMMGLGLLLIMTMVTLLTPLIAPRDPAEITTAVRLLPPSATFPMGTDDLGRDVFSRVLYGGRISLSIGILAVAIAISLGTVVGAVAGYAGGWIDTTLMRLVDVFLSFPRIVLLVTVVALFSPSIALIVLVLGLTGWMGVSRLVRGQVLTVKEREFVQAARALGYSDFRILGRHILPSVLTPVIIAATLGIGNAILAEAALSFLGLGVPPEVASWGNIIRAGAGRMLDAWWITLFPGLAIVLTVMSFNLVGDGLRDALDPRTTP